MPEKAETRQFIVPETHEGERLDVCIAAMCDDLSRSAVQRLIDAGNVTLDGDMSKAAATVEAGQRIVMTIPPPEEPDIEAQDIPLDIVYEDGDLLVVNKDPGMVVHPGPGHPDETLINALLAHCAQLSGRGGAKRPGLVHRLDQDTSGLVLVAKSDEIHRRLSEQIERREVKRIYQTLVWGIPEPRQGHIATRYGRNPHHRTLMAVLEEGGRRAVTDYAVAEPFHFSWTPEGMRRRDRQASLVVCSLQTGRTHQIRVHMQHIGHPVISDQQYGDPEQDTGGPPSLDALVEALQGQALHAARLTFTHPGTDEEFQLSAPPPPPFMNALQWLREHDEGS
ncbi:MAG: RluA family pseudouridine synthase [Armatimonadota bacterium]